MNDYFKVGDKIRCIKEGYKYTTKNVICEIVYKNDTLEKRTIALVKVIEVLESSKTSKESRDFHWQNFIQFVINNKIEYEIDLDNFKLLKDIGKGKINYRGRIKKWENS